MIANFWITSPQKLEREIEAISAKEGNSRLVQEKIRDLNLIRRWRLREVQLSEIRQANEIQVGISERQKHRLWFLWKKETENIIKRIRRMDWMDEESKSIILKHCQDKLEEGRQIHSSRIC